MRISRSIIWFIIILIVTNLSTYSLTTRGNKNKEANTTSQENNTASQGNNTISKSTYDDRLEYIYQEIKNETLENTDEQEAYDHVIQLPDKSFIYQSNGNVYILNGGQVLKFTWEDPLDINEYYQDIIQKFIELYKRKEHLFKKDDIIGVGFMPEVIDYEFKNIYPDTNENYKALIRYYTQKRKTLELEMAKYKIGESTIQNVEKCYIEYTTSKSELMKYINSITPGDL